MADLIHSVDTVIRIFLNLTIWSCVNRVYVSWHSNGVPPCIVGTVGIPAQTKRKTREEKALFRRERGNRANWIHTYTESRYCCRARCTRLWSWPSRIREKKGEKVQCAVDAEERNESAYFMQNRPHVRLEARVQHVLYSPIAPVGVVPWKALGCAYTELPYNVT